MADTDRSRMPHAAPGVCSIRHSGAYERMRHSAMFQLIATVKRGSASSLPATWSRYPNVDAARAAAAALLREDRVQRVMIVRDEISGGFVEWQDR